MRVLLDTHVFLWYLADSPRLTEKARRRIEHADEVLVSAASIWEAALKSSLGKLKAEPQRLADEIRGVGFAELPVVARHCVRVASLPWYHRDPFDRLLISQTLSEGLDFLTADSILQRYSEQVTLV